MAARVLSPTSEISRAEPAVSAATIGLMPSCRITLRHCPSACTWLSTVLMSSRVAPFTASNWWRTGMKCSAMMCSPDSGIRWWMSATRPATEFSIGIMPRSASPDAIAANASSNVAQGMASRLRIDFADREVRIRPRLALECDFLRIGHGRSGTRTADPSSTGFATATRAPARGLPRYRRRAARRRRWRRRSACRPRARAAARASRAVRAARAAAPRSARARRGDRHRARCGGRAARRRRAPSRG